MLMPASTSVAASLFRELNRAIEKQADSAKLLSELDIRVDGDSRVSWLASVQKWEALLERTNYRPPANAPCVYISVPSKCEFQSSSFRWGLYSTQTFSTCSYSAPNRAALIDRLQAEEKTLQENLPLLNGQTYISIVSLGLDLDTDQ